MQIVTPVKLITLSLLIAGSAAAPAVALSYGNGLAKVHTAVMANPPNSGPVDSTDTTTDSSTGTTASTKAQTMRANHEARLTAVKLKVCQNRQKAITNIMSRIADRGQKQLDLFSTIATRVETFYTDKGKTLSNYDALVTAVNDKKAAAQTTVDTIKTDSTGFSCDSNDPKGSIATFKTALKSEIQALKDYKTAVKNLIVGVKSVQGTTNTTDTNNTEAN
jgi:hypothetical protein